MLRGKRTVAKATTPNITQMIATLDKEMNAMQRTIQQSIKQEIANFDKLVNQVQGGLTKARTQKKTAHKKRVSLAKKVKEQPTAPRKKELKQATSVYDQTAKMIDQMTKEMGSLRDSHGLLKNAHNRFDAMFKAMEKFENQWDKKQLAAEKKRAKKKPRRKKKIAVKAAKK